MSITSTYARRGVKRIETTLTAEQVDALVVEAQGSSIFIPPRYPRVTYTDLWSGDGLVLVTADGVTYIGEIDDTPSDTDGDRSILVSLR